MKLEVEMLAADGAIAETHSFSATDYTLDEFGTLRIYEKREDVASGVPLFMVPRGGWRTVTRCAPIVGAATATDGPRRGPRTPTLDAMNAAEPKTRGTSTAVCSGRVAVGLCVAEFTVTRGEARHNFCAEHLPEGLRGFLTLRWREGITDHPIVVTTVPR